MELLQLIPYGTPVLVLGMIVFLVRIDGLVRDLREDVRSMKDNVVYRDTCDVTHRATDRRLERLEHCANGAKR